jgi:hypothetical protein
MGNKLDLRAGSITRPLRSRSNQEARDVIEQIFLDAARMAGDPRIPAGCLMDAREQLSPFRKKPKS